MIAAALADVLCCPQCRGDLRLGFSGLECTRRVRTFPIRHGIPRGNRNGASISSSMLQRTRTTREALDQNTSVRGRPTCRDAGVEAA